jgi:hypothetical protein
MPNEKLFITLYFLSCYAIALLVTNSSPLGGQFGDFLAVVPLALMLSFLLLPVLFIIVLIMRFLVFVCNAIYRLFLLPIFEILQHWSVKFVVQLHSKMINR